MGYSDPVKQREYQRDWQRRKKAALRAKDEFASLAELKVAKCQVQIDGVWYPIGQQARIRKAMEIHFRRQNG